MSHFKDKIETELREVKRDVEGIINFLATSDFYTAPASTRFHDSEPGGLAYHSWVTFQLFKQKNMFYKLNLDIDTVRIAGLLHDLCKVNYYQMAQKWRKDDQGRWESYDAWEVNDQFPLGHGEKSVIVAMQHINLNAEEMLLIRYHMGAWDAGIHFYPMKFSFGDAVDMQPSIIALASADWESRLISIKDKIGND